MSKWDYLMEGVLIGFFTALLFVAFELKGEKGEVQGPVGTSLITREQHVKVTGYHCPTGSKGQCDKGVNDGRTATNSPVRHGVCAADWTVFHPGEVVYVTGYGTCRVEDTGRRIKGRRLDAYFEKGDDAKQWGVKVMTVWRLANVQP